MDIREFFGKSKPAAVRQSVPNPPIRWPTARPLYPRRSIKELKAELAALRISTEGMTEREELERALRNSSVMWMVYSV
jgi:hypothetical protein